jgi:hypothetical protein
MTDISAPGPESVHILTTEHQLTQEEIVPVVYRQFSSRWQNWILPAAGVCLVAAGASVLGLDSADTVAWAVMLTLGLVILAIFLILVPITPNRIWKRVGRQFEVRTLEITDEGIHRHTALNDTTMRWPMFSEIRQRDQLYLLIVGKGPGSFIIPIRAFTSKADEDAFRRLAERLIPVMSETASS